MNKKYQVTEALLSKMFEYAGYPAPNQNLRETKSEWCGNYQMSNANKLQWMDWGANYIQQELGVTKDRAKLEMYMLAMTFGLKTY
jgi:hypothetical protein